MNRFAISTLLVFLAIFSASPASAVQAEVAEPADPTRATESEPEVDLLGLVENFLAEAMAEADVPGVAVAVVRGQRVLLLHGQGFADVEHEVEVDPTQTLFRLGSLAKTITGTTVLASLEGRSLNLDSDARPFLSRLDLQQMADRPLSFVHLLTHTGGYNENLFGQHAAYPEDFLDLASYLERRLPPTFAHPGEVIAYSDFHTSLAGLAIAELEEEDFPTLVERRVFAPLGMTSSSFRQVDLPPDLASRMARSYTRRGDYLVAYPRDYIQTTPAAGLQSTASDMAHYLMALLNPEVSAAEAVMSPAAWRQQQKVAYRFDPRLLGKALGLTETRHAGRTYLYKNGQASGFNARLVIAPADDLAVFAVHNRSIFGPLGAYNAASKLHEKLAWAIFDAMLPSVDVDSTPPQPTSADPRRLARFEGTYRGTICSRHTVEKTISIMDTVRVRAEGDGLSLGSGPLVEIEPGVFQWHEGGSFHVAFSADGNRPSRYLFLGAGAFERIPWYETGEVTIWIGLGFIALFAAAFIVGLFRGARLSLRPDQPASARRRAWALVGVTLCNLLFVTLIAAILTQIDIQELFQGWPVSIRWALALPLVSSLPYATMLWSSFKRSAQDRVGPIEAILVTTVALCYPGFCLWLRTWNLLGWSL